MGLPSCTGAGGTGTKYTYAQLMALWINAGGGISQAPTAAAIAMAESGGCSAALNDNDNGGKQSSWGLWQISDGTHNQPAPAILNPENNAAAAVEKWRNAGYTFTPWGSYTSGAYRQYVSNSTTPDYPAAPPSVRDNAPAAAGAAGGSDTCAIGIPKIALDFAPDFPGICLLSKAQLRSVTAVIVIVAGAAVTLAGVALLAKVAMGSTAGTTVAGAVTALK